jgi:ABC-type ATPase involved in cell division
MRIAVLQETEVNTKENKNCRTNIKEGAELRITVRSLPEVKGLSGRSKKTVLKKLKEHNKASIQSLYMQGKDAHAEHYYLVMGITEAAQRKTHKDTDNCHL